MQTCIASSPASYTAYWAMHLHRGSMLHTIRSGMHVKKPAILLAVVAMLFVTATCTAAMWYCRFDPRLTAFCAYLWLFYGALYQWRRLRARCRRYQHAVLRRGLGYAAVGLGVFLSAIFLYSFARVIPLPQAIGVWLFALLVAYCLYRVFVLHVEEEEEGVQVLVQVQGASASQPPLRQFEV